MFFENIYSPLGIGMDEPFASPLSSDQIGFIFNQMRLFARRVTQSKNHNLLCGPFIQNPENPGRKKENIAWNFGQFMDFDTTRWCFYSKEFPTNVVGVKSEKGWHYVNDPAVKEKLSSGTQLTLSFHEGEEVRERTITLSSPLVFQEPQPISVRDIQEVIGCDTRVLIHSTFSGGNKRRAFILYDRLVSPDEHELIARDIYAKIVRKHPHCLMDYSCTRANSLFYLPCQAAGKTDAFIDESGTEPFDVDLWLGVGMALPSIPGPPLPEEAPNHSDTTEESVRSEELIYEQKVTPLIRQMRKNNHFTPAQRATAECKRFCPGMRSQLEIDLSTGGLDKKRLKSMLGWFDRMRWH